MTRCVGCTLLLLLSRISLEIYERLAASFVFASDNTHSPSRGGSLQIEHHVSSCGQPGCGRGFFTAFISLRTKSWIYICTFFTQ